MHLVELFLPLDHGDGTAIPPARIEAIVGELAGRFGGVTAFLRSPAKGLWKPEATGITEDQIVVVQVMVEELDLAWWRGLRADLEREFAQEEVLIRAIECRTL